MSALPNGVPCLTLRAYLPPGALLRFRTTARYWNDGKRFGPYGDFLVFLLKTREEDTNITSVQNCVSVTLGPTSDLRMEQHYLHESCAEWCIVG